VAAAVGRGGTALVADLLDVPVPNVIVDACVCDPPWYPDHAACFVNAATMLLRPGGALLLAFAGPLTRPGIEHDRAAILDGARADGFTIEATDPRGCRYVTPPFEYAAMASAGLHGLPPEWRSGELITLRRGDAPTPPRRAMAVEDWAALEVDNIPLRVRATAPPCGSALLSSLVDGDVLATVSRRARVRESAALWTSRNRIFASSEPPRLAQLLRVVAAGDLSDLGDDERDAAAAIRAVVRRERGEHRLA
jgi:hypothetical protein